MHLRFRRQLDVLLRPQNVEAGNATKPIATDHLRMGKPVLRTDRGTKVSSAAVRVGSPGEYIDYSASKAAVDAGGVNEVA